MSTLLLVLAIVGTVAGIIGGACAVRAIRASTSFKIQVVLMPEYVVKPGSLGLADHLMVLYDHESVAELRVFKLQIRNNGIRDILQQTDAKERVPGIVFPSISFQGFRILGVHTLANDREQFYIPLAKAKDNTVLWLNLGKIRAGTMAEFLVVGVPEGDAAQIKAAFHRGFVPQLKSEALGILEARE